MIFFCLIFDFHETVFYVGRMGIMKIIDDDSGSDGGYRILVRNEFGKGIHGAYQNERSRVHSVHAAYFRHRTFSESYLDAHPADYRKQSVIEIDKV